ncbi:MAG: chromosome segregation protein SMC [Lachnospiraceae bacterium]|nr:chromosome segregation protein SMC [Lachnospiraceae bacterium]
MYLKSIEIQGFKSFANKIILEFHDGITGIVGPNGSGKSNIADAVRWVLGEQSAKQLRGANMQDVIFSGSEVRKPMGSAFVEITFDNTDHKLAIAYDEVSVARRVYRSGESEYLINGSACRLKDVQELFMDTGIGKEGYSIIGQGQIDKILSTKPEDRRELFDEAAGIVKFKKRKAIAEKNLAEATDNLSRIMDIIGEIEKQIGPLEKQSETAKEYLRLKEILKKLELNNFLCEYDKAETQRAALAEKCKIAEDTLEETREANKNAENEFKKLDGEIEECNKALDEGRNSRSELLVRIEKLEGEIKVYEQQLLAITQNSERINERVDSILGEIKLREKERTDFEKQKKSFDEKLKESNSKTDEADEKYTKLKEEIESLSKQIEEDNAAIIKLMNKDSEAKTELQKYSTLLEQANVRRSEIAAKLLTNKSDRKRSEDAANAKKAEYDAVTGKIAKNAEKEEALKEEYAKCVDEVRKLSDSFEETREIFLEERSKLESLRNICERYEGYGQTVRKIMESREKFPGIDGVVADLIKTQKKYETAVETALGASISHIVTEDEETAKEVIEYLKKNKLGRATFLPITSVGGRDRETDAEVLKEKGVISTANELVTCDDKYKGVIDHLLKAFIVTDNIDNALTLARKYKYSLRIVTLEGEQFAPGGSIAGGSFKNNSNLLGRTRELEEIENSVEKLRTELEKIKMGRQKATNKRIDTENKLEDIRKEKQQLTLEQNSAKLTYERAKEEAEQIAQSGSNFENENLELEESIKELKSSIDNENANIEENKAKNDELKKRISDNSGKLLELRMGEGSALEKLNKMKLAAANTEQAGKFVVENIGRIDQEIERLKQEKEEVLGSGEVSKREVENKKNEIKSNNDSIKRDRARVKELDQSILELTERKENIKNEHKNFFDSWTELGKKVTELEKEAIRLNNQKEKLEEQIDSYTSYIWEEYELSYAGAQEYREEDFKTSTARSRINDTKASIKALGDVNVNSIEEFKSVSERYALLSGQRDDLINSKKSITGIINELDEEMRKQFKEQFELIATQFNSVFRELFGGGKGELELIEDEDMLEAGIRIIAQPPGKKLQNMMQLSGGEKALTAISLLFAIQNLKPSPFCLLDEIEAALDDSNVKRFASYLHKLTKNSQFIVITHRRGTMTAADRLYGITMQEKGVSTLVSVSLIEGDLDS